MDPNYSKANSNNIPKIDIFMIVQFLGTNPDFYGAELRGIKAARCAREGYGDEAVGFVQIKRCWPSCFVKCQVTPEHRVRLKGYAVTMEINEKEEKIIRLECLECKACQGGCKHAIVLLFWLHRRSEEPSPTETVCYWRKSKLGKIGTSLKFVEARKLGQQTSKNKNAISTNNEAGKFFEEVIREYKNQGIRNQIMNNFVSDELDVLSLHYLMMIFKENVQGTAGNAEVFIDFARKKMLSKLCETVSAKTVDQSDSNLWHEMRYGRITASKIHEAAQCHTMNGSLVETILGAKVISTKAMNRGKDLEGKVLSVVQKTLNTKIQKVGIVLNSEWPVLGASPDGLNDNSIFEVKCPASEKTVTNYIKGGKLSEKCKAQMMAQMIFCRRKKGYLCIALPDFETSRKVQIIEVQFDKAFCTSLFEKATNYWKKAIFPVLYH